MATHQVDAVRDKKFTWFNQYGDIDKVTRATYVGIFLNDHGSLEPMIEFDDGEKVSWDMIQLSLSIRFLFIGDVPVDKMKKIWARYNQKEIS
ncbi:MAG: hypothetical protein CL489_06330 [Acidobacteria bacterium]|nr:hypothetical protein [Acidobacteriota bacterium]